MLLGRVVGSLVASQKEPSMEGFKLLVVRRVDVDGKEIEGSVVAVDAVIMAIVDSWEVEGREVFRKE